MTELAAQLEADRLRDAGMPVSLIACNHEACTWRVIVTAEVAPREAVRVVVALGGRAHINAKGEVESWCPAHPDLALPAVIAP